VSQGLHSEAQKSVDTKRHELIEIYCQLHRVSSVANCCRPSKNTEALAKDEKTAKLLYVRHFRR